MADRLQLIPASAKRAEGVNFEVRLDRLANTAGEMINVDLKVCCPMPHTPPTIPVFVAFLVL